MIMVPASGAMGGHSQVMQFPTSRATPTAPVSQGFNFDLENIDIFFLFYIYILLNDKITIIVNLQYRKGFLYWC